MGFSQHGRLGGGPAFRSSVDLRFGSPAVRPRRPGPIMRDALAFPSAKARWSTFSQRRATASPPPAPPSAPSWCLAAWPRVEEPGAGLRVGKRGWWLWVFHHGQNAFFLTRPRRSKDATHGNDATLEIHKRRLEADVDRILALTPVHLAGVEWKKMIEKLRPNFSSSCPTAPFSGPTTTPSARCPLRHLSQNHQRLPLPVGRKTMRRHPSRHRNRPQTVGRRPPSHPNRPCPSYRCQSLRSGPSNCFPGFRASRFCRHASHAADADDPNAPGLRGRPLPLPARLIATRAASRLRWIGREWRQAERLRPNRMLGPLLQGGGLSRTNVEQIFLRPWQENVGLL